ncbi:MAG TPA: 5-formyltetrahydrofolate cyclo-ligase [Sphingobacteriaceae bacterium]|nr:5-formyltetrahydrofolate cyclo-ligase [Sphingobacteriaceae bacterium]
MTKASLRKDYLEKRLNLTRSRYWHLNDALLEQFKTYNWHLHECIHVYLPIADYKEIDTFSVLSYFKEFHPNLNVVIPKTDFKKISMKNILYDTKYTILGRNKYGIPEPIHGKVILSEKIDAVLLPLLAFDLKGNRVGYGKGFYDRFLAGCKPETVKIGLSFFDPVDQISDMNEFDVQMNMCITPEKIWKF